MDIFFQDLCIGRVIKQLEIGAVPAAAEQIENVAETSMAASGWRKRKKRDVDRQGRNKLTIES